MKTFYLFIFSLVFIVSACKSGGEPTSTTSQTEEQASGTTENATAAIAPAKRYDVKSGMVVYKGPMGVIQTLYFENYGAMEVFTTELEMMGIKNKDTQIRRDGYQYSFKSGETTGTKTKWYTNDMHFSAMDAAAIARYKVKKLGNETIAGKNCEKYSAEFGGSPMTTWVWNNLMIKSITNFGGSEMIIEATKVEEGPVDAALFEVPANITFTES